MASIAQEAIANPLGQPLSTEQPNLATQAVSPYQLDVNGYQATAGSFRRGLRAGFNSIGTMLNNLAGQTGVELGLTQFAQDRFKAAEEYASMADAIGPEVRDISQIKDFTDLTNFVTGMAGQGLATSAPAIGLALGLRRPALGIMAGSMPLETGEQIGRLRADPNVKPGDVMGPSLAKGAAAAAMDATFGAERLVANRILSPSKATGGVLKTVGKGTVQEGATEAAQNLTGQAIHKVVNPEKEIDWHEVLNDAAAGAAGGGGLGVIGGVAGALPEAGLGLAKSAGELKQRIQGRRAPPSLDDEPEGITADSSMEDIVEKLKMGEEDVETFVKNVWERVKTHPAAEKFKDLATNPEARAKFEEDIREAYNKHEFRPKFEAALKQGQEYYEKGKAFVRKKAQEAYEKEYKEKQAGKPSLMRNRDEYFEMLGRDVLAGQPVNAPRTKEVSDFLARHGYKEVVPGRWEPTGKFSEERGRPEEEVHRYMVEKLKSDTKKGATPKQLLIASRLITRMAREPGAVRHGGIAHGLQKAIGEHFEDILNFAIDQVHSTQSGRTFAREAIGPAFTKKAEGDAHRMKKIENIIRTYARDEYQAQPDFMQTAREVLAPRILDALDNVPPQEGPGKTASFDKDLMTGLDELFGERSPVVKDLLDGIRHGPKPEVNEKPTEINEEGEEVVVEAPSKISDDPYMDPRIGNAFRAATKEELKRAADTKADIERDYGRKNVRVSLMPSNEGEHMYTLELDPADQTGFDQAALNRIREQHHKSGLQNGVLTIRKWRTAPTQAQLDDKEPMPKVDENAISIPRMVGEMIRTEEKNQRPQTYTANFVADMFARGLASLTNSDMFAGIKTEIQRDSNGEMVFPDDMPVAKVGGKEYYWKDIKTFKMTRKELADVTDDQIKGHMERIRAHREKFGYEPMSREDLYRRGVAEAVRESRENAMKYTELDPLEDIERKEITEQELEHPETMVSQEREIDEDVGRLTDEFGVPVGKGPVGGLVNRDVPRSAVEKRTQGERALSGEPIKDSPPKKTPKVRPNIKAESLKPTEPDTRETPPPTDPLRPKGKYSLMENKRNGYDEMLKIIAAEAKKGRPALLSQNYADRYWNGKKAADIIKKQQALGLSIDEIFALANKDFALYRAEDGQYRIEDLMADDEFSSPYDFHKAKGWGTIEEAVAAITVDLTPEEIKTEWNKAFSKGGKFSTMNIGKGDKADPVMMADVRAYIEKVLGPKAEVIFAKMEAAGHFANISGIETIKIAIDAIDPKSVGYHEAVHALFERLMKADKKAAHVLMRAAQSPTILAKLNQLLKDHPEARAQLKDPEEAAAYMYQFWANGMDRSLLNVGPETKTWFEKIKSFFRKIAAVWADDMAAEMDAHDAGLILDAFHNGRFADPNTVAEVLADMGLTTRARAKADALWPSLGRFVDKAIWTASGAVRDMGYAPLTAVMDQMHPSVDSEVKEPGFLQMKYVMANRFTNRVVKVLQPMTQEQQRIVLNELRKGNRDYNAASREIGYILDDLHEYMVSSGVKTFARDPETGEVKYTKGEFSIPVYEDLRKLDNYFPRVPDLDYLREHKAEFIELLNKHKVKNPDAVYAAYTTDPNMSKPPQEEQYIGLTYFTPQTNERTLWMIPDSELAPFLNKDLFGTLSQYIVRAARRAEYTKRFGNVGENIRDAKRVALNQGMTADQAKTFDESISAMEGSLSHDMSPQLKAVFGGLVTYQNIRLLPLALFSSLVDPGGISVRGGTLGEAAGAFFRGIRELVKNKDDDAAELAKLVGTISAAGDMAVLSDMYGSQYMPKIQQKLNDAFFKFNGMESWNRSMRIAATQAAVNFIKRHVERPNEHSERYLRELGLTRDDVKITPNVDVLTHDGKEVKTGGLNVEDPKIQTAINRWVDQAILRPNAAMRPIYMSDPMWMLVSHLKQYTYLFQQTILKRVYHEAKHGNYSPAFTLAGYVPMIIAADMARIALTPGSGDDDARRNWDTKDWLWRGVQRAGIFGPGQLALDAGADLAYDKVGIESLAGPTAQQLLDFARAAAKGEGLERELIGAVPGSRLFR